MRESQYLVQKQFYEESDKTFNDFGFKKVFNTHLEAVDYLLEEQKFLDDDDFIILSMMEYDYYDETKFTTTKLMEATKK